MIVAAITALALIALPAMAQDTAQVKAKKIAILIPGNEKDNGFMEAAYRGYKKIQDNLDVEISYVSNVSATSDIEVLTAEMKKLAAANPDMIIGHGGQCNSPAETISKEFPNIQFVVIQGNVKGDNLTSYSVDQEQSAFLAGALAGLETKTNKVGHISGAWPKPGLKARAAFFDGLKHTNPKAEFYSWFTGNLDDKEINKQAADAEIKAGVDIIYTMLNAGRQGVNDRIKATDGAVKSIGNVIDWTKVDSSIFIGSAVADSSVAIFEAASDFVNNKLKVGQINVIGLENQDVVRLAIADNLSAATKDKIAELRDQIIAGKIKIKTDYTGQEFNPATGQFVDQSFKEKK